MRQQPRIRQNSTIPFGISPPSGEILEEQIWPGALERLRKQNVLQHELWVNVVVSHSAWSTTAAWAIIGLTVPNASMSGSQPLPEIHWRPDLMLVSTQEVG